MRAERDQLRRIEGVARPDDDGDHHIVLGELAGHAECRSVEHARVELDDFFDFERRDVLAPAADAVGPAADEVEEAIGIAAGEVAGVEPQVASRGQRSSRHSVVAVRHQ